MGHIRLGQLPRTRKWLDVVELIAAGADVAQVAAAVMRALEKTFSFVQNDAGYNQAVWLLTQLGLAAKHDNPLDHLRRHGVDIPANTSLPEIVAAFTDAFERHTEANAVRSALGPLAQRALVDAVLQRLEPKLEQQSLFNMGADTVKRTLSQFGTEKEFGLLARAFYGRLTEETMKYFLSQTLASNLGEGQRFASANQIGQYEEAVGRHCREASAIVEDFAGSWFGKHRWEEQGDISRENVIGFGGWALKKMKDEMRAGSGVEANEQ